MTHWDPNIKLNKSWGGGGSEQGGAGPDGWATAPFKPLKNVLGRGSRRFRMGKSPACPPQPHPTLTLKESRVCRRSIAERFPSQRCSWGFGTDLSLLNSHGLSARGDLFVNTRQEVLRDAQGVLQQQIVWVAGGGVLQQVLERTWKREENGKKISRSPRRCVGGGTDHLRATRACCASLCPQACTEDLPDLQEEEEEEEESWTI